jgi:DNA-binding NarL/FixJ family response regulator
MTDARCDATPQGRVLVLEDEVVPSEQIRDMLSADTEFEAVFVRDVRNYVESVKDQPFDAVSIDWQIGEYTGGINALQATKKHLPQAAAVVYSRFPDQEEKALKLGADVFVPKTRSEEYTGAIYEAVRVGMARKIRRELLSLGHDSSEMALPNYPLEPVREMELFSISRRELQSRMLQLSVPETLRDTMIRRRWWTVFNDGSFARLDWREKLRLLLSFADVTNDDVFMILGIPSDVLDTKGKDEIQEPAPDQTECAFRSLMSLCSFTLRLSHYEPELMAHYWEVTGMAVLGQTAPPWDNVGLKKYLKDGGIEALEKSLNWIRSIR